MEKLIKTNRHNLLVSKIRQNLVLKLVAIILIPIIPLATRDVPHLYRGFLQLVLYNWVPCVIVTWGEKVAETKRFLLHCLTGCILHAIELVFLELMLFASCMLCWRLVTSVDYLVPFLMIVSAFFILNRVLRVLRKSRGDEWDLVPRNTIISGIVILIVFLIIDQKYIFKFTILVITSFLVGIMTAHMIWKSLQIKSKGLLDGFLYIRILRNTLILLLIMFFSMMNFSALGRYRFFVEDVGYELKHSLRAEINSDGFRGPEIEKIKSKNTFRIVSVGDSTTYGVFLEDSQTYSRKLEALLRENITDAEFEVINAGVPAYNIIRMMARLEKKILDYKPNVIILMTGANDGELMKNGEYENQLNHFIQIVKKHEASVIIATYPFATRIGSYEETISEIKEFSRKHNIIVVDIYALLVDKSNNFFIGGHHPNSNGNDKIANEIYRTLIAERVIPRLKELDVDPASNRNHIQY